METLTPQSRRLSVVPYPVPLYYPLRALRGYTGKIYVHGVFSDVTDVSGDC